MELGVDISELDAVYLRNVPPTPANYEIWYAQAGMELHLSPESLDAFLRGTSGAERATTIEAHIDTCEECRVLLSSSMH